MQSGKIGGRIVSKEKCVELIEEVYEQGEVVGYPRPVGKEQVLFLADRGGYWLQSVYEPKEYASAVDVANALFEIDRLDNEDGDHWYSVRQNLDAII